MSGFVFEGRTTRSTADFAYLLTVNEELRAFIGKPLDFGTRHDAPAADLYSLDFSLAKQIIKMTSADREKATAFVY